MRAVLGAGAPGAPVVDVSHGIEPQAVDQASFVLDCVFNWFPPETIFVAVVDPGVGTDRADLVVETGGRFIVGPDNGIAGDVLARHGITRAVVVEEGAVSRYRASQPVGRTFLGRDVFAPAAAALAEGVDMTTLGAPARGVAPCPWLPDVVAGEGCVRGRARFVDTFGNILTNIATADLESAFPGLYPGELDVTIEGRPAGRLRGAYGEVPEGTLTAVVNSWNRVEVSINQGRAIDAFPRTPPDALSVELRAGKG
jgi:hypothetical protein